MFVRLGHAFLSGFVRPILHRFGYELQCTHDWVPPEKKGLKLLEPYRKLITDFVPKELEIEGAPKIIWQFWWQGAGNAPLVVKRCMESVRYFMGSDYQIIVLDKDNVTRFVEVDEVVWLRHESGEMTHTHFSDYLRAKLLSERGGVWIDATVFLSARIPNEILNAKYFIFKSGSFALPSEIPVIENLNAITEFSHGVDRLLPSSWFLVARAGSPINRLFVLFENEYWRRERCLYNYYLYHMLTTYAVVVNQHCRVEFSMSPLFLNLKPHLLMFRREEPACDSNISDIFAESAIHKMTYKYNEFTGIEKSLLGKLLSGELLEYAKQCQSNLC